MTKDLTEQWKKGELEEGFYYVDDGAEATIDYYLCDYWERHFDSYVQQILAEVPDYIEWKNYVNGYCEEHEYNLRLQEENDKLKELLKDARNVLKMVDTYCGDNDSINEFLIVKRIDEVLK